MDDDIPSNEDLRNDPLLFVNKFFFESNPAGDKWFHNMFMKNFIAMDEGHKIKKRKGYRYEPSTTLPPHTFIGVDWAKDSGMNRGDVISRDDNVIEVRFKTATINK